MKCLVIGRGPWGQNIARTLSEMHQEVTVVGRSERLPLSDAVFIATPASTHCSLVNAMFSAGVPVFCEKPMVVGLAEAAFLRDDWLRAGRPVFLVNHLQLFNEDVERAKVGQSLYIYAEGPGPFRPDCSGLWDWGSHAVAEALYLSGATYGKLISATADEPIVSDKGISELVIIKAKFKDTFVTMEVGNRANMKRHFAVDVFNAATAVNPLQRAISLFLGAVKTGVVDHRFGMELPYEVCRFLESVDDDLARQGISRPQRFN